MNAKIVALEGIDGSGKGTQSQLLTEPLRAAGRAVTLLSFPRYADTRFGAAIGEFLNGRFGELDQVSPYLISVLYSADRFESRSLIEDAINNSDVLVLDRYTASNVAHQGARVDASERRKIISWIEDIEYDVFGLPRPDLTLLLDVSVDTSQKLILKKAPRDYTDESADLQESNVAYMSRVREFYLELATRPDWHTIRGEDAQGVRAVEEIARDVADVVTTAVLD